MSKAPGRKSREKTKLFSCRIFPLICFFAFLAVSLYEEPKKNLKIFFEIRPKDLKESRTRKGRVA
jgi:hypothetical protein